ncbi:MAG: gamma-glutamylcyclotransferase [Gammaproteobacteria bacterium]|nr:gamma-glutamylcyclotransferase [Gammaproteobacteria bacterium]
MLYFSYGSNMSIRRLRQRVPSARFVAVATLHSHELRCHKVSRDGSGKCDAFETGHNGHRVIGVVFAIPRSEKPELDRKEGLGRGYAEKMVQLVTADDDCLEAVTYYATVTDGAIRPYHWYKQHVLIGAAEYGLPLDYIEDFTKIESVADPEPGRHVREMEIYRE